MLAQAQECVFHKAVVDGKTPSLVARLAKQQHIMYVDVERAFGSKMMEAYFDKTWLVRGCHCKQSGRELGGMEEWGGAGCARPAFCACACAWMHVHECMHFRIFACLPAAAAAGTCVRAASAHTLSTRAVHTCCPHTPSTHAVHPHAHLFSPLVPGVSLSARPRTPIFFLTSPCHPHCPALLPGVSAGLRCPTPMPDPSAHLRCPPYPPAATAACPRCRPALPTSAAHLCCPFNPHAAAARAEQKVDHEIALLQEAFQRVQATKKVWAGVGCGGEGWGAAPASAGGHARG
eukprot:359601-Chlamydomonas_euryale.AAC.2